VESADFVDRSVAIEANDIGQSLFDDYLAGPAVSMKEVEGGCDEDDIPGGQQQQHHQEAVNCEHILDKLLVAAKESGDSIFGADQMEIEQSFSELFPDLV